MISVIKLLIIIDGRAVVREKGRATVLTSGPSKSRDATEERMEVTGLYVYVAHSMQWWGVLMNMDDRHLSDIRPEKTLYIFELISSHQPFREFEFLFFSIRNVIHCSM